MEEYFATNEMVGNIAESIAEESYSPDEYRLLANLLNDKFADTMVENIRNSTISLLAKNSLINWLNTWGRHPVSTANMTNRELEFSLRAEISLACSPCRRSDLDNPQYEHLCNLLMDHYFLSSSNATGPHRLGNKLFERTARVSVGGEVESYHDAPKKRLF